MREAILVKRLIQLVDDCICRGSGRVREWLRWILTQQPERPRFLAGFQERIRRDRRLPERLRQRDEELLARDGGADLHGRRAIQSARTGGWTGSIPSSHSVFRGVGVRAHEGRGCIRLDCGESQSNHARLTLTFSYEPHTRTATTPDYRPAQRARSRFFQPLPLFPKYSMPRISRGVRSNLIRGGTDGQMADGGHRLGDRGASPGSRGQLRPLVGNGQRVLATGL